MATMECGQAADVVQDDLAVRAEHLGQAADDGQQRLHARVEREQTTLRRSSLVAPQGAGGR